MLFSQATGVTWSHVHEEFELAYFECADDNHPCIVEWTLEHIKTGVCDLPVEGLKMTDNDTAIQEIFKKVANFFTDVRIKVFLCWCIV